jgi:hypothetical protein
LVLLPLYGKMLPLGGIVSKANRGIRQLDRGFYGAGFPHPGAEATLEQANKLLMHYGCRTALGMELQTSFELLVVDLGLSFHPFKSPMNTLETGSPRCGSKGFGKRSASSVLLYL